MDLDAVVSIAIADLIIQELRTVSVIVVVRKLELIVVAGIAISSVVNIGILDDVTNRTGRDVLECDSVCARIPAFKPIDRDIRHFGADAADAPLTAVVDGYTR